MHATINSGCTNIFPGELICLALQGEDCQPVAVVQSGDTCSSIAAGAAISTSTLIANNPNLGNNCQFLYPGEVVCVDSSIITQTPNN